MERTFQLKWLLAYPQSTFEALFVKAVDGRDYFKELVDALLIIEVSKLLESLLDLLSKSLRLADTRGKEKKSSIVWGEMLGEKDQCHLSCLTLHGRVILVTIWLMFQAYLEGLQQASGEEPSQTNIFPVDCAWSVHIKTYFLQLY